MINYTQSKVTFNVKGNEHTIYFPKKNHVAMINNSVNSIQRNIVMIGRFKIALPPPAPKYATIMVGTIPIKYEVS